MEVRILACMKYLEDLEFSLKLFRKYFPYVPVYIHSDGSIEDWRPNIPNAMFIDKKTAEYQLAQKPELKKIMEYRQALLDKGWVMVMKMVDLFFLSNAERILVMDSDCFFVREPTQFKEYLKTFYWVHAQGDNNSVGNAEALFGKSGKNNAGAFLQVIPTKYKEYILGTMDWYLGKLLEKKTPISWCSEQGFWHVVLSGLYDSGALDKELYRSTTFGNLDWDKVEMIHTTGAHPDKEKLKKKVAEVKVNE